MKSLNEYADRFDLKYPKYADGRYAEIQQLVERYDTSNALIFTKEKSFTDFVNLVSPLIAIKNYKSQVPFPEKIQEAIICIINIRSTPVESPDIFANHNTLFNQLISFQGFQLPTVSAIFHFCHPNYFPIVDKNVEAACETLKENYPEDFLRFKKPKIPAPNTSSSNKMKKYLVFIYPSPLKNRDK